MSHVGFPEGFALCPVCHGSCRIPATGEWKSVMAGYDKATDTFECDNCGGQTMYGKAKGYTKIDPATGEGCKHEFVGRKAGNCYHVYTCTKCGSSYDIDSGD
jgi:uncharacterized protein with PIN domain